MNPGGPAPPSTPGRGTGPAPPREGARGRRSPPSQHPALTPYPVRERLLLEGEGTPPLGEPRTFRPRDRLLASNCGEALSVARANGDRGEVPESQPAGGVPGRVCVTLPPAARTDGRTRGASARGHPLPSQRDLPAAGAGSGPAPSCGPPRLEPQDSPGHAGISPSYGGRSCESGRHRVLPKSVGKSVTRVQSPESSASGLPANSDLPRGAWSVSEIPDPGVGHEGPCRGWGDNREGRGLRQQEDPGLTPCGHSRLWFFPGQNKSGFLYKKVSRFYNMRGARLFAASGLDIPDQESWAGGTAVPRAAGDGWPVSGLCHGFQGPSGWPRSWRELLGRGVGRERVCPSLAVPAPAPPGKGTAVRHAPLRTRRPGLARGPPGAGGRAPGQPQRAGGEGSCPGVCGRLRRLPVRDASSPLSSLRRKRSQGRGPAGTPAHVCSRRRRRCPHKRSIPETCQLQRRWRQGNSSHMRDGRAARRQAQPGTEGGGCSPQPSGVSTEGRPPACGPALRAGGSSAGHLPRRVLGSVGPGTWAHPDAGGPTAARGLTRWSRREQQGSGTAGPPPSLTSWGQGRPHPGTAAAAQGQLSGKGRQQRCRHRSGSPGLLGGGEGPHGDFQGPPADVTLETGRASIWGGPARHRLPV